MFRLYDTATSEVRELALRTPGKVGIYLCGPTVYGPPHLGHGRATLVYDILRRYLEWSGLDVRLVSNITDIDDKIIDRANKEGRPWQEITHKCEDVWFKAMGKLNVLRPTDVPHATEYVDSMVNMIGELISRDNAYVTEDGVYLNVLNVPDYGLLAHQSLDDMLSGGGDREVFGAGNKKNPADFALWKFSKPGEPFWAKDSICTAVVWTSSSRTTKTNAPKQLLSEKPSRITGCTTVLWLTLKAKKCQRVWAMWPIFLIFLIITTRVPIAWFYCKRTIEGQFVLGRTILMHRSTRWLDLIHLRHALRQLR